MIYFNWHLIAGILGGLMAFLSIIPYAKDILHGTTRPNIVSNILWFLIIIIYAFAQISSGASWSLLLIMGDLLGVLSVVIFCIAGYGYKKYSWVEYSCFILGLAAIVLWQVTSHPIWAICFAAAADFIAGVPVIVKTYRDPWSEHPFPWLIVFVGSILGILSTTIWDVPNLLLPFDILFINGLVALLAFFGRRLKSKHA
jgi:hypothetical protein